MPVPSAARRLMRRYRDSISKRRLSTRRSGIGKPTKPTTKHGKTGHTETQADREQEAKEYYDEFGKEIIKAQNSMQDDINKNAIDTMSAGTEKQVAQINANKAKELAALDKTITDLAQKKMDVDKKAWLKVHPKAGAADYAATAQGKQTLDDYKKRNPLYSDSRLQRQDHYRRRYGADPCSVHQCQV